MAITSPTPPTPPTPPKITIGDAARDAQTNQTHTTGDAQAEQQARDSVAQGNGALSKTTRGAPKEKSGAERPNAAARTDAAKGDAVSTSAAKVDRGTQVEGQTGADVARGLDTAQENALLRQQLGITEQQAKDAAPPPPSYTPAGGLYWAGLLVLALAAGVFLFRRFAQKKQDDTPPAPSLGERILAQTERAAERPQTAAAPLAGAHDALLAAAERTRRARDTRGEILPEYTGLTAGEALARLQEPQQESSAQSPQTGPHSTRRTPPRGEARVRSSVPPVMPAPAPAQRSAPAEDEGQEKPRFEVRV